MPVTLPFLPECRPVRLLTRSLLRRWTGALLLCAAPLSLSVAQSNLPQLGDSEDMSIAAERKLGQSIAREIYRDPDYLDDPLLAEYVQGIWQPLVRTARAQGHITPELQDRFAWEVMLARDRSVNAFALPGGYLGVHLGLIALVANRDELASVLAHELTHVTQRHIARSNSKKAQQAPWLMGAMILAAIAASKHPEAANATLAGSQAVGAQAQLNFSRDMEREADRIGFSLMEGAGFDAQGFVGMFDKLQLANRINDNGSFPYLRSHPLTSERIGDMQSRLQLAGIGNGKKMAPLTAEHAIMATRARILADPSVDMLRNAMTQARSVPLAISTPAQLASLYAGALAALKLRDLDTAQQLAARAAQAAYRMTNGPVAQENQAQRAINLIANEIQLAQMTAAPGGVVPKPAPAASAATTASSVTALARTLTLSTARPETLLGAQMAIASKDAGVLSAAADRLQNWVARAPTDANAWAALASVYTAQGQSLRAVRAEAEARVALLDYSAALDRLRAGQHMAQDLARRGAGDHIESSIMDSRARTVQEQIKELTADNKSAQQ